MRRSKPFPIGSGDVNSTYSSLFPKGSSVKNGLDADAQSFVTAAGITDPTQKTAINDLVIALKAAGVWTPLKAIYPFVGGTAGAHKWNLKNPVDSDAAFRLTFSGSWTHSATGALPDGTTGYADTHFNQLNDGVAQSESFGFYSGSDVAAVTSMTEISGGPSQLRIGSSVSSLKHVYATCQTTGGAIYFAHEKTTGFYQVSRIPSGHQYLGRNSVIQNGAANVGSPENENFFIGAANSAGVATSFSNKECRFAYLGGTLTLDKMYVLNTIVQEFQTSLGRWVSEKPVYVPTTEIEHIIGAGQSLMAGGLGTPVLSVSQPYDNITFGSGVRSFNTQLNTTTALVENTGIGADSSAGRGETPISAAVNDLTEKSGDPADFKFFGSTAAWGGTTVEQLSKGGLIYPLFTSHLLQGYNHAVRGSASYLVRAILFGHGESDQVANTSYDDYKLGLTELLNDYQQHIIDVGGQADAPQVFLYQVGAGTTDGRYGAPLAQLDLSNERTDVFLACPIYQLPFADNLHLTNVGYFWLGKYFGRVMDKVVNDTEDWKPLSLSSANLAGSTIILKFNVPAGPIVFDTTNVGVTTDQGFSVVDDVGDVSISSVTITDIDEITIVTASAPGANPRVRYGLDYIPTGSIVYFGGGGNLRDSEVETFSISATEYNLYNWCVAFEAAL